MTERRNPLDDLNYRRSTSAPPGKPNRIQAYGEIADLLNEGVALTSGELKALLVNNGYSPRTDIWGALGRRRDTFVFTRITGVPIEAVTYMGRYIIYNTDKLEEANGLADAKKRIERATGKERIDVREILEQAVNQIIRETR